MYDYILLVTTHLLTQRTAAQDFSLYPTVDPDKLAQAFNISVECLDALNTSLPCDQTLFQMTSNVDNYWWETDNLTDLCTRDCFFAVDDWNIDVQNRCAGDNVVAYNKIAPAESIAGRYYDGIQIACLTNGNSSNADDDDERWCLVESQNWVGSDVVRPDCSAQPTDPSCSDPLNVSQEDERLANLYGDDVLCSDCFMQMMYQRLVSEYLSDSDYSDYLIVQYQDILDVCDYTNNMPELVIQAPPNYETAVPPPLNISSFSDTGCVGQTIVKSTLDPNANCATIAQAFNVATGAVQAATGNVGCVLNEASICLPAPCTLYQVPSGATCDSLASTFSTSDLTVTAVQFLNWNPSVNGLCDSLQAGDYVCASAPGGLYVPPPPPTGSTDASDQSRGGSDGSNGGAGTGLSPTGVGSNAASPTQTGIVTNCNTYAEAQKGEYCSLFAQEHGISTADLYSWNPVLGANGANCDTEFWLGYYYCIGVDKTGLASLPSAA